MPRKVLGKYAEGTTTPVYESRAEIERTLIRYGARDIGIMLSGSAGVGYIIFVVHNRRVKMEVRKPNDEDWKLHLKNFDHPGRAKRQGWDELEEMRRWRVCLLQLKAKLEASENDPIKFEQEFLANILLPNNTTVGDVIRPMIQQSYDSGHNVLALPGLPETDKPAYTPPRR